MLGLTGQNADKLYDNLTTTSTLSTGSLSSTSVVTHSLTVGKLSDLPPAWFDSTRVTNDLNVSAVFSTGAFSSDTANVVADVIDPSINTGLVQSFAVKLGNRIEIYYAGKATGLATTLGTVASAYRPIGEVTTGQCFTAQLTGLGLRVFFAGTMSMNAEGVLTPSQSLDIDRVYFGSISYTM